jgi:hypothetical protein
MWFPHRQSVVVPHTRFTYEANKKLVMVVFLFNKKNSIVVPNLPFTV